MAEIINKELSDYEKSLIEEGKLTYEEAIKIPQNNKVKIGYKEYEIVKEPEIIEVVGEYFGKTEPNEEKIFIASKYMQKQQNQTFLHELLHCIADKYNLEVNHDEHTIELLSVGLYEAIIDNPHIFTMKDI